jgi:serine/threonine protein kinase
MWGVRPLNNLDRSTKYNIIGRPLKQSIPYIEDLWKQGEIVKPLVFPENLRTESFFLGDFGLSMRHGTAMKHQGRPSMIFCSPDRLHNQEPSFSCDIWSYMCIFIELYFGLVPFSSWLKGGVVTSMVQLFGPLPKDWKGHYFDLEDSLDSWYDHDDKCKDAKAKLEATIKRLRPEADPVEQQHVFSVLSWGFSMDPNKRPSATQLLRDPSFTAIIDRHCR